ncbi:hypothetical protein [Brevundimonas sp.]|uniref:hypothetical protein n=1 Tax=Brevundimonas sp. TaxID=1871086 RepID=UPI002D6B63B0|nr:hypothetical protein [Brevundimonas sp.]HYD26913.1 hypothetical protein [Brevundimonas sp.]
MSEDPTIEVLAGAVMDEAAVRDAPDDDAPASAGEKAEAPPKALFPMPDPDLAVCPVTPLGFEGKNVVFAMPEGEIRSEPASKIGPMLRTDIFVCRAGAHFLTLFRNKRDEFEQLAAVMWFVRACRDKGKFDRRRTVRGLGVWPGTAGEVVLHKGDEIWTYGDGPAPVKQTIGEALKVAKGPLYLLQPAAEAPSAKPAGRADGTWISERLDWWRFEPIGDEGLTGRDLVLGWVMAAMLGAVPAFRVHLLLYALAGSGKTTFLEFVHALLSAVSGDVVTSFTEAGLRSDIAGMARPVLLDELEASDGANGPGAVERVLDMLRLMATGSGASRKQGAVDGGSMTQTAVGSVLMAAISPPRLDPALATRVAEVRLLPLTTPRTPGEERALPSRAVLKAAISEAADKSPALLTRALTQADRFRDDVAAMMQALTEAGEAPRTADLISTLAAGRRLLLHDSPLTREEALEEARFWQPLLDQRAASETVSNPGADALLFLFDADSGKSKHERRLKVGEWIQRWIDHETRSDSEDVLKHLGLRVLEEQGDPFLLVANRHPFLEKLFARSRWPDWKRTFAYLDALGDAYRIGHRDSIRFGLAGKQRATVIPLTPWLERAASTTARSGGVPLPVPEDDIDFR